MAPPPPVVCVPFLSAAFEERGPQATGRRREWALSPLRTPGWRLGHPEAESHRCGWFLFASWVSSVSSDNIHGEQICWIWLPTLRLEVPGWGGGGEGRGEDGEKEDGEEEGDGEEEEGGEEEGRWKRGGRMERREGGEEEGEWGGGGTGGWGGGGRMGRRRGKMERRREDGEEEQNGEEQEGEKELERRRGRDCECLSRA